MTIVKYNSLKNILRTATVQRTKTIPMTVHKRPLQKRHLTESKTLQENITLYCIENKQTFPTSLNKSNNRPKPTNNNEISTYLHIPSIQRAWTSRGGADPYDDVLLSVVAPCGPKASRRHGPSGQPPSADDPVQVFIRSGNSVSAAMTMLLRSPTTAAAWQSLAAED